MVRDSSSGFTPTPTFFFGSLRESDKGCHQKSLQTCKLWVLKVGTDKMRF